MRNDHLRSLGLLALIATFGAGFANAGEKWEYEIVPFLWAASIDGREGVRGFSTEVHADFSDLVEFVDTGAAMRVYARRPPLGWFGEANYVELESDVGSALGPVSLRSTSTIAELGLSYELTPQLAVYGGARYQNVSGVISTSLTRTSESKGWVDAMVGGRWTPLTSEHWVLWVRADAGGGSSDFVWLAEAGGGYRWGTRWGAYLAYRSLDTDYRDGGFLYDLRQSGLLFGFGIRF